MSDRVLYWYGCNAVRHGDIIHNSIALLKAVGIEVEAVGGPTVCCGNSKDANIRAAAGMAARTVQTFNEYGRDTLVTWCPSCHRHMSNFMTQYNKANFEVAPFTQMLHARRDRLTNLFVRRITRRVVLHLHVGFQEAEAVETNRLVIDLLRLIPGLELVVPDYAAPGHMCSILESLSTVMKDVTQRNVELIRTNEATDLITVFHSCQRILCPLQTTDGIRVLNYVNLLAEALGWDVLEDEYGKWRNADTEDEIKRMIGADRLQQIGVEFFDKQMLPELRKRPK